MDSQSDKLNQLSQRIHQAERDAGLKPEVQKEDEKSSHTPGYELLGSILGGGILGWLLDHTFGTTPWCVVGMVMLGFVAGIISAWRAMQNSDKNDETKV